MFNDLSYVIQRKNYQIMNSVKCYAILNEQIDDKSMLKNLIIYFFYCIQLEWRIEGEFH